MKRHQIVAKLRESHPEIQERFGVASLSLFGSASRDELRGDSDIDVLVSFDGKPHDGAWGAVGGTHPITVTETPAGQEP